jgi:Fe-S cluster assembly protein SufD
MSNTIASPRPESLHEEPLGSLHTEGKLLSPENHGHWPEWFAADQAAAWQEFQETPEPRRTDEGWRFSNIRALSLENFHTGRGIANEAALMATSQGFPEVAAKFVFANDRVIGRELLSLPEGVIALPLEEAIRLHEDLFRSYFLRQPVELGSHKYARLHHSQVRTGLLLYVPPGVEIASPVEAHYWVEGQNASIFPHTLVILGEGSKATVIDHFHSADGKRALACGINDLHVGAGAHLNYFAVQNWASDSLAFHLNSTIVGKDAISVALTLNFGGAFVRGESLSELTSEGAHSEMLSINPVTGDQMIDQRTLQLHSAPGATSDLLYHNTLDEQGRTVFAGLIKVAEGAHRTDAYQKVRNLLLSDDAEANSMPGLEILADEVKCSHGATSGELNEEELFYLEARGIPREVGRRMVVMGFFDSLLDRIKDEAFRDYLSGEVRKHLRLSDD